MPTGYPAVHVAGALGLLERAIGYTRTSLQLVTSAELTRSTPCRDWDLETLLHHMNDSLLALQDAADLGYVDLAPVGNADPAADIVATLRARACSVLGAWTNHSGAELVSVAGCPLTASILASTGALEIAVHGWDVAQACGQRRPLPTQLADELLELVPLLVSNSDRPARFGAAADPPRFGSPGDRLLAALGRRP